MGKILNNPKECILGFVMLLIVAAGIIAEAGAINYAKEEGALFAIAGIANIIFAIYGAVLFYQKYLKPTNS